MSRVHGQAVHRDPPRPVEETGASHAPAEATFRGRSRRLRAIDLLWLDDDSLLTSRFSSASASSSRSWTPSDLVRRGLRAPTDRHVDRDVAVVRVQPARLQGRQQPLPPGRGRTRTGPSPRCPPHADTAAHGLRWYGWPGAPTALTPAVRDEIARLGRADIMVGIPSFKNAATIGHVVRAAHAGLVQYFPELRPVLVNCRRGLARRNAARRRRDRTAGLRRADPARPSAQPADRVTLTYPTVEGVSGKGAAVRTMFEIAADLDVQALVRRRRRPALDRARMDRAPRRTDPQGRLRLRRAALRPLQVRRDDHEHRHLPADAGALRVPAPPADRRRLRRVRRPGAALPRARRLDRGRQPVRHRHLDDDVGADRWLRDQPGAPRARRSTTRRTRRPTSGRCSARSSRRSCGWPRATPTRGSPIRGSHDVPTYGFERIIDPPPLEVNTIRLLSEFHSGSLTLAGTWESMIAPDNVETVLELAGEAGRLADHARTKLGIGGDVASTRSTTAEMADALAAFHFPDDLWARVMYDLVLTARRPAGDVERFVAALVPLYFGRVGSFVIENRSITTEQVEDRVERQAREFELLKPYLVERWRTPAKKAGPRCAREPLAAPRADPHPGRQPADRRGADPARRGDPRQERTGELTALGIVEVPEGMPLVGRRDARPARPTAAPARPRVRARGNAIQPDRPHRPARGRGHRRGIRRAGGGPRHLRLGRQGAGRPQRRTARRSFSPTIDEVVRDSPCDIAVVKQRDTDDDPADPRPGPRRAARGARAPLRRRDRPARTTATVGGPPPRPARDHGRPSAPRRSTRSRPSSSSTSRGRRGARARGVERPGDDPARGREGRSRRDGRVGPAVRSRRRAYLFGALPEAIAARAQPTVIVVKTREPIASARRSSSSRRGPRRSPPPIGRPRRRARSRPASSAGSASRTSTIPSSATSAGCPRSRRSRA